LAGAALIPDIIAAALERALPVVTADQQFVRYGVEVLT